MIVLEDDDITSIIRAAALPEVIDEFVLAQGIRDAISCSELEPMPSHLVRDYVERLHKSALLAADAKIEGIRRLRELVGETSPRVWAFIDIRGRRLRDRGIGTPALEDFSDDAKVVDAAKALINLLQVGAAVKAGRARPGGKQSRPALEADIFAPTSKRGRPPNLVARSLVMWLAIAYQDAGGDNPPFTVHPEKPGPFARLVALVLAATGLDHINAIELVNWYGRARRR